MGFSLRKAHQSLIPYETEKDQTLKKMYQKDRIKELSSFVSERSKDPTSARQVPNKTKKNGLLLE
jgi:hypothetical protein